MDDLEAACRRMLRDRRAFVDIVQILLDRDRSRAASNPPENKCNRCGAVWVMQDNLWTLPVSIDQACCSVSGLLVEKEVSS